MLAVRCLLAPGVIRIRVHSVIYIVCHIMYHLVYHIGYHIV